MTDAIVNRFTRDTGIAVEQLRRSILATDTLAVYQSALEAQSSDVDVLMIDVTWPRLLAAHLVDLAPMLTPEASQQYASIIQNNTVDNRLVAMPNFADIGILFYRTDLLARYGFPAPPATWEELEQQAKHVVNQQQTNSPNLTGSMCPAFMNERFRSKHRPRLQRHTRRSKTNFVTGSAGGTAGCCTRRGRNRTQVSSPQDRQHFPPS